MPRVEPETASRFAGDFPELRIPVGCQANEEAALERNRSVPAVVAKHQAFARGEVELVDTVQKNSGSNALDFPPHPEAVV